MPAPRFHVRLGEKRTTVSLNTTLVELLALHLGHAPDSAAAHTAIRGWLQCRLDEANDPHRYKVSQWLQSEIVHALVGKKLYDAYSDWILSG